MIALNVDIRGFSQFSEEVVDVLAALYMKKVYQRLIDDYFDDADFFKPTGDGLLVVYGFKDETLKGTLTSLVRKSLRLVDKFATLTKHDDAINFDVPTKIGIGLARGAGSRLMTGKKILDYSGRTLNLASRLMDFARPEGVVLDAYFGVQMLPPTLRNQFERTEVAVRGISEKQLVPIYYTSALTTIPDSLKRPFVEPKWRTVPVGLATLAEIQEVTHQYRKKLPSRPLAASELRLKAEFPKATAGGQKHKTLNSYYTFRADDPTDHIDYEEDGGVPTAIIDCKYLASQLATWGVKPQWSTKLEFLYPEA